MQVRLLSKTTGVDGTEYESKSIDEIVVGIARISSGRETNDLFTDADKLIRYCILNGHYSIFEQANLVFEVITSRAIGRQLIRHKSLFVQEISQRYVEITQFEDIELRKQKTNNRQSSEELFNPAIEADNIYDYDTKQTLDGLGTVALHQKYTNNLYKELLRAGTARETARMILPETAQSKLIFNGTIRSWITTLNQRLHHTAQKEVRDVANEIKDVFIQECPVISSALFNFEFAENIHILDRLVLEKFGVFNLIKENDFKKIK
jgi:thymidylate synthase (FAD)